MARTNYVGKHWGNYVPFRYRLAWALGLSPAYRHPHVEPPPVRYGPGSERSTTVSDPDQNEIEGVDEAAETAVETDPAEASEAADVAEGE